MRVRQATLVAIVSCAVMGIAACTVVPPAPDASARTPAPAPASAAAATVSTSEPAPAAFPQGAFTLSGEMTQGGWLRGTAPVGTTALTLNGEPVPLAPDGQFLAAFDRDSGPVATLMAERSDGSRITKPLAISPRDWRIERINAARRSGGPSETFMKRRMPELEAINASRAKVTDAQGWRQDFIWPVKARISGLFGSQRIYRGEPGSYHSGIDIAPGAGAAYVAPADGVVVLAVDDFSLEGKLLIIDHGMGLNSAFLHSQQLFVKEGDHVKQGQRIGLVGSSGRATGPHLHWSLKWHEARLDPLLFTGPMAD
ncbi:M23 family metallopeptidase [Croceicoccus bisphenolivorans]|uniref:M23 family metallopeptidase n=1 Tax=Croceicoccus bisphenolivorans TaxID=1783232 RepID=UPI00082BF001|nr:M23 family metallopeptidase [Croceicoccus bisphenolivorans]